MVTRDCVRAVTLVTVTSDQSIIRKVSRMTTRDRRVNNIGKISVVIVDDVTFRVTISAALAARRPVTGIIDHHVTCVRTRVVRTNVAHRVTQITAPVTCVVTGARVRVMTVITVVRTDKRARYVRRVTTAARLRVNQLAVIRTVVVAHRTVCSISTEPAVWCLGIIMTVNTRTRLVTV